MEKRIKAIIEYDGTAYSGFQVQNNGLTIQEVVEKALEEVLGHPVRISAASRTDAGVHARGQVIAFNTVSTIPPARIYRAANNRLPSDIRMLSSQETAPDFHPRYDAREKRYQYLVYRRLEGSSFWRHRAWIYTLPLDISRMQLAASRLQGRHNLASFCASGSSVRDYVRTVYTCCCREEAEWLTLDIAGEGFLYHMVRIIMGTLVEIGRGFREPEYMDFLIRAGDRTLAGPTAPASGLYLQEVIY